MTDDARVERVAEALWQAESVRARGGPRLVAWTDESNHTREQWRFMARAAIAAAEPRWQPIETAPKDKGDLLLSDGKYVTVGWYDPDFRPNGRWLSNDDEGWHSDRPTFTHWMPLPQPPGADNE